MRFLVVLALLLTACGGGASSPPATVSPTASPMPTDVPSPTPRVGSGIITFGTGLDNATLQVITPKTEFAVGEQVSWSAAFSEPAGATSLDLVLSSVSASGAETVVYTTTLPIADPAFDLLGNTADLAAVVGGPGTYAMRYFRGATQLAHGQFTIKS